MAECQTVVPPRRDELPPHFCSWRKLRSADRAWKCLLLAVKKYLPTTLARREDGSMVVPRTTKLAEDFAWGRKRFLEEARILATLEGVPPAASDMHVLESKAQRSPPTFLVGTSHVP